MKTTTVSIGIPAYNEEANIKKLLMSLLNQKADNFILSEIIVVSDESTDGTCDEVKSIHNDKIHLVENKKRLGQAGGQNTIISLFTGDVLVLLNADVLPANEHFIGTLVDLLESDKSVGMVGPKIVPLKGVTFFEKVINYSVELKDAIFERVNCGNNLYLCRGAARAFKKEFARKIQWKDSWSEDAFSYLSCLTNGYKFKYVPSATLYFKSPDNFSDHLSQSSRFATGPEIMCKFFDSDLVKGEYAIPKKIALAVAALYLAKNPLLFLCYVVTLLLIRAMPRKADFARSMWKTSASSKILEIS